LTNLLRAEGLRVLLVSAQEGMRDEVKRALTSHLGDYRLYWVSQPDLALVRTFDVVPDVILVDEDLGDVSPVSLIGQLAARVPETATLALVGGDAFALARQAVLAGARGFVTKPVQEEELLAALRQVLTRGGEMPEGALVGAAGRIVVFCAPKGGTGRTTLAINTAVSLQALSEGQVALIDADYAAPALDVALNLNSGQNITALLPKLSQLDDVLISQVLVDHASGMRVLLAPPPADLSSSISLPQVQQVLAWLKRMFPWVMVDLGLPLDETAFAFLDGADRIVMTVLPEMIGLRNTRLMLDQLLQRGYPASKVWLVLNRSNLKGGLSRRDIKNRLRVELTHTVPEDQALATYSINRGVPLVVSHPRSAVARAVRQLAQQLAQEMPTAELASEGSPQAAKGLKRTFRRT